MSQNDDDDFWVEIIVGIVILAIALSVLGGFRKVVRQTVSSAFRQEVSHAS